ncbi:N-formylglutamate amidohydrolase [Formosa maritima]|uniref:N-formylglutamate amidohydrolase n=1 Tax=Formosa maritima TaxID=2592046 RepID=A0A5D0G7G8_9FLAO|nr:N-formylglutamate amidohydrolase [Formosa maritima]TYA54774.1 N-formylglutamate amidohydrolase [Formosa maritima]
MKLVLTCEHGGNTIPKEFAFLFKEHQTVLNSHKGYDLGSLDLFETLKPLSNFFLASETSRLLIELNRSLHHNKLFSEFSKTLSIEEKEHLIQSYYLVYRNTVENKIKQFINAEETVLHISVHSFTPVLNSESRNCDIGLLFDSRKPSEKQFSKTFKEYLAKEKTKYRVRFNYPYLGKADGFTTYLRKQFPKNYIGIELEINQKFTKDEIIDVQLKQDLYSVLKTIINQ